jgi:uncharacterized UBP type Zn finger protein
VSVVPVKQNHHSSFDARELLASIGQKYDQYLDFRQQDAHEFLRHLLDAMQMEEVDVSDNKIASHIHLLTYCRSSKSDSLLSRAKEENARLRRHMRRTLTFMIVCILDNPH